jgi:sugar/nucleoside kinase (ribokinase family)
MIFDYDVLVAGSYSIDLIFSGLDELPELGKDVVGTDFMMSPGEAFISAISMHRLGLKVGWAADFGNDVFSQMALNRAREEGLDDSLFIIHERPYRRISAAASYPGDRLFITYYDPEPSIPAIIPALMKNTAQLLFIPGLYTGELLGLGKQLLKSKKMKLVIDGNSSSGDVLGDTKESAAVRRSIKSCDLFLPNAQEARRFTGEQELKRAIFRLSQLCPLVVIKDGDNGSLAWPQGHLIHVPAISVNPVDTTGAGDNFDAGFLCAWLDGKPIETCLKWGNIVGGLSTTAMGGTTKEITRTDVNQYLGNWIEK